MLDTRTRELMRTAVQIFDAERELEARLQTEENQRFDDVKAQMMVILGDNDISDYCAVNGPLTLADIGLTEEYAPISLYLGPIIKTPDGKHDTAKGVNKRYNGVLSFYVRSGQHPISLDGLKDGSCDENLRKYVQKGFIVKIEERSAQHNSDRKLPTVTQHSELTGDLLVIYVENAINRSLLNYKQLNP